MQPARRRYRRSRTVESRAPVTTVVGSRSGAARRPWSRFTMAWTTPDSISSRGLFRGGGIREPNHSLLRIGGLADSVAAQPGGEEREEERENHGGGAVGELGELDAGVAREDTGGEPAERDQRSAERK